jgi:competence protein ComEC
VAVPAGVLDGVRTRAQAALDQVIPPAQAGLLRGMVLGDDSELPPAVREDFRASGLSHLVAASGTNVMLLATLAIAVGMAVGLERVGRLVAAFALIALYVPLAGGGPSIQRAGIMGTAVLVAALAGRPGSRWYALGLAAAGTLALDPRAVTDLGWQLSFAAVLGILLLAPRWREGLRHRGVPPGPRRGARRHLGRRPSRPRPCSRRRSARCPSSRSARTSSPPPPVAPVMWLGFVAAAARSGQPGARCGARRARGSAARLPHVARRRGGASCPAPWSLPEPSRPARRACPGRPRVLAPDPPSGTPALALAAVAAGFAMTSARAAPAGPPTGLRVTALDVGQGDAILVQEPGRAVLVDTGPPDGDVVGRLRQAGVDRLDALVITHASSDHEGGAPAVLRELAVGVLVDGRRVSGREPDELAPSPAAAGDPVDAAARAAGVRRVEPAAGQVVRTGGLALHVRWPPPVPAGAPAPPVADHNERATVLELDAWGARVLLPADAESDVLGRLDLDAVDVLKVSHHGSADDGLAGVLARLRPRVALIPVGRGNPYGHPAPSTLRALQGVPTVLRTDEQGTIRLDHDGGRWLVHTAGPGGGGADG